MIFYLSSWTVPLYYLNKWGRYGKTTFKAISKLYNPSMASIQPVIESKSVTHKTALVTGASSGIGYELAKCFAEDGWDLVIVSRNGERLSDVKKELENAFRVGVRVIDQDLSEPGSGQRLLAYVEAAGIEIDALVNNAGFGAWGKFAEIPWRKQLGMINLNITSLTELTRLFLPPMLERRRGYILNVASTAAFQPGPLMAVYYASKAYVVSFSEALAFELRQSGVRVTALCPGPTESNFQTNAGIAKLPLFKGWMPTSQSVARFGFNAMKSGRVVAIHGLINRVITVLVKLIPKRLVMWAVFQRQSKPAA